jgi:hypothetical protein
MLFGSDLAFVAEGEALRARQEARLLSLARCHRGSVAQLVQTALLWRAIGPPAQKRGGLPKPTATVTGCHGFVKVDVKSSVITVVEV